MRLTTLIAVCLFSSCLQDRRNPPPSDAFYFPAGIHHAKRGGSANGVLYVVSANFDRRYDTGILTAVDLDALGLPAFPATVGPAGPLELLGLPSEAGNSVIEIANFGGDMGAWTPVGGGPTRLFIPSRAEGQKLMEVDADGLNLTCVPTLTSDGGVRAPAMNARDCGAVGASLVELESSESGVPRADSPMSVAVTPGGVVWVTSGRSADSPRFSGNDSNGYVVRTTATETRVESSNFFRIGVGGTHAVALGKKWAYFSGRFVNPIAPLVRLVKIDADPGGYLVINSELEREVLASEARGIALSSDEHKLFLAARVSDGNDLLAVATISDPQAELPFVRLRNVVSVSAEPQMVQTLSRGIGRGDLVLVTCAKGATLEVYDDETQLVEARVSALGLQPSSFTVDRQGGGARVYISNFTDGTVAVVDIPNLDTPQGARLVARIGRRQLCLTRGVQCIADGGSP